MPSHGRRWLEQVELFYCSFQTASWESRDFLHLARRDASMRARLCFGMGVEARNQASRERPWGWVTARNSSRLTAWDFWSRSRRCCSRCWQRLSNSGGWVAKTRALHRCYRCCRSLLRLHRLGSGGQTRRRKCRIGCGASCCELRRSLVRHGCVFWDFSTVSRSSPQLKPRHTCGRAGRKGISWGPSGTGAVLLLCSSGLASAR